MRWNFEMNGPLSAHGELADKEFRDSLVEVEVRRGLPVQIREMREERGWSQAYLGELIGKPQNNISRIENTRENYLSIKTLLDIASAFDVALLVKFVPFSELVRWTDNHSRKTVVPASYDTEIADEGREAAQTESRVTYIFEYLKGSPPDGRRRPPQRSISRALYGTNSSPKSSRNAVVSTGANEPAP